MKIVNITGGLGNQMFQYAFALSLKHRNKNEEVYVDTHHYKTLFFKRFMNINLHNGYEIDKVFPNANLMIAKWWQISKVSYYIPNYIIWRLSKRIMPKRKSEFCIDRKFNYLFFPEVYEHGNRYFEGTWESVKYYEGIKDILQHTFSHPAPDENNKACIQEISSCNSVGIHVRRGDYLYHPDFRGLCEVPYYKRAIEEILKDNRKYTFYIFSNDSNWCEKNIRPLIGDNEFIIVEGNKGKKSCWDMFLMEYCKDLIIANSSFSWWGAMLNKTVNRVIAPSPWVNREGTVDIYDPSWIKINCM